MDSTHSKIRTLSGTPKHLSRTGELNSFTYLMINLLYKCNYRCLKCFNIREDRPIITSDLISLDDRISLIHQAREIGGKVVVIAGEGEPLLHREIGALVSEINRLGMIPIIYSNGSTLNGKLAKFYNDNNVSIMISFDSLNQKLYRKLTGGKGNIKKVKENIENTIDIYRNTKQTQGDLEILRLGMNATVSDANAGEIAQIKEYWGNDIYFVCNPLLDTGNANPNWCELMSEGGDPIVKYKGLIRKLSESGGPLTLGKDGRCGYSKWGIGVGPRGDYMTCAYTGETDGWLGHIGTKSMKEAFEHKHKMEAEHHKEYGTAPCLIRMPSFNHYLQRLKSS